MNWIIYKNSPNLNSSQEQTEYVSSVSENWFVLFPELSLTLPKAGIKRETVVVWISAKLQFGRESEWNLPNVLLIH